MTWWRKWSKYILVGGGWRTFSKAKPQHCLSRAIERMERKEEVQGFIGKMPSEVCHEWPLALIHRCDDRPTERTRLFPWRNKYLIKNMSSSSVGSITRVFPTVGSQDLLYNIPVSPHNWVTVILGLYFKIVIVGHFWQLNSLWLVKWIKMLWG